MECVEMLDFIIKIDGLLGDLYKDLWIIRCSYASTTQYCCEYSHGLLANIMCSNGLLGLCLYSKF